MRQNLKLSFLHHSFYFLTRVSTNYFTKFCVRTELFPSINCHRKADTSLEVTVDLYPSGEPSGYAEIPDNWIFVGIKPTLKV
jgi:hypothetical protein